MNTATKPKHPTIKLTPVKSSQIYAAGHDPDTKTLALQFKGKNGPGSVYHYPNMSAEKYADFLKAPSLGKFFAAHIKGHKDHPHTKLED